MLTNVQTAEVSLVRRGANNKRIALTKSEDDMDFQELLKTVLATEAEGESKLIETLKAANADEDTINAAVANFRLQNGFKDKLSKDVFGEVAKAAGYEIAKAKKGKADDDMDDDDNPFGGKKKKKTEKSHVPADMPAEMQAIFKAQQDEMEALRKENAETTEILKSERRERIRKEYIAKCASDYSHVPGMTADAMGEMLQKAYEVSDDFGKQLEKQWADTHEAVRKSALLVNQGVISSNDGSSGAWSKMQSLAKELVQKTEGLSEAKALDVVMKENPELYQEYLDENPAQVGRR
jgi:hypothetical protein